MTRLFTLLLCLLCAGCPQGSPASPPGSGAKAGGGDPLDFLAGLPQLTLHALNPEPVGMSQPALVSPEATPTPAPSPAPSPGASAALFHGYAILGSLELEGEPLREAVAAVRTSRDQSDGTMARCFSPRHGLQGELDGRRVDLVICFECDQMVVDDAGRRKTVAITGAAKATLNRLLDAQAIPRDE